VTRSVDEQRLNEDGPSPIRPEDTLHSMSSEDIQAELFGRLSEIGITPPSAFSAARNEQVRALMGALSPFRTDSNPLNPNRSNLNRILILLLELRARELRHGA